MMVNMLHILVSLISFPLLYFAYPNFINLGLLALGWLVGIGLIWLERSHVLKHLIADNAAAPQLTRSLLFYVLYGPTMIYLVMTSFFVFGIGVSLGIGSVLVADMMGVLFFKKDINAVMFANKALTKQEGMIIAVVTILIWIMTIGVLIS